MKELHPKLRMIFGLYSALCEYHLVETDKLENYKLVVEGSHVSFKVELLDTGDNDDKTLLARWTLTDPAGTVVITGYVDNGVYRFELGSVLDYKDRVMTDPDEIDHLLHDMLPTSIHLFRTVVRV